MTSTIPHSSASTLAAPERDRDVEALKTRHDHVSHFKLVWDQAAVTSSVLNHNYPGHGTTESPYIVDFLSDDAHNPLQFPVWKKWMITILQAIATLAVAFVSTAFSGGIKEVIMTFKVNTEIAILGVSLFVLGFAIGPLMWAPLSGMSSLVFQISGLLANYHTT
jgi:hypothetical protein